ncbi:MAG: hypothetical protein Tsb0021_00460 [Chlamydiales bacterium]
MDYYGFLNGKSVSSVFTDIYDHYLNHLVSVVRSIDSSHLENKLEKILDYHNAHYIKINGNICLTNEDLLKAISLEVFTGFDELWFFENYPDKSLGDIPGATSDGQNFNDEVNSKILNTFHNTNCILLLADGCGLNFLTNKSVIAKQILENSP